MMRLNVRAIILAVFVVLALLGNNTRSADAESQPRGVSVDASAFDSDPGDPGLPPDP